MRIAGVEVGEVTGLELVGADPRGRPCVMTMRLDEQARPLREDATFQVRPRLFIDGNYFVDLHPGSPSAAEVSDGHTFGLDQTAHTVQLDQVLTTLQSDVRSDVRTFLDQFGNALIALPRGQGAARVLPQLADRPTGSPLRSRSRSLEREPVTCAEWSTASAGSSAASAATSRL